MEYENWINDTRKVLVNNYGLSSWMAERVAWMLLYLDYYKIKYTITSTFRDPKKQADMRKAWDRGEGAKYGLVVRPAADSLHSRVGWLNQPAAEAIDIKTANQHFCDEIAAYLGLGLGSKFSTPDPVHYYNPTARK